MKFISLTLTALLILPTLSQAKTDWTAKFKPMTNGCGYLNLDYNLEPRYKSAILDKKMKVDSSEETEEQAVHQTIV